MFDNLTDEGLIDRMYDDLVAYKSRFTMYSEWYVWNMWIKGWHL